MMSYRLNRWSLIELTSQMCSVGDRPGSKDPLQLSIKNKCGAPQGALQNVALKAALARKQT